MTDDSDGDTAVERQFDTDQDDPATAVAETVAELRGVDTTELATTYGCIGHLVDHLFSDPPSAEAEATVAFSYEGYRVTVGQDGSARFVPFEQA